MFAFRSPHAAVALALAVAAAIFAPALPVCAQRFLPDDPIWNDPDRLDMPIPQRRSRDEAFDPVTFLVRSFASPGSHDGPAVNVNTLGEVPNSSWYTNRHAHDRLSVAALRTGPNRTGPPDRSAAWRVIDVRTRLGRKEATVLDASGRRFSLVFDPTGHPELATGAAMIASRLLYAAGYNVPEHYLTRIGPDRLVAAPDSGVTRDAVWGLFNDAPANADGTYRVVATHVPDLVARVGPFRFHGTRSDDGNDIFPHEGRRELRGLRVVAAWINHSKIRSATTLDAVVRRGDRQFVTHYLTDLDLTLGSGDDGPKAAWSGHEHVLEWSPVFTRIGTLGLSGGDWMDAEPSPLRGVGLFTARDFRPEAWKPEYPNPAFDRCDPVDAFWAARQVAAFTREDLAAVVDVAAYSDPAARRHVLETLVARRDSIVRAYAGVAGGLDGFDVRGDSLHFVDLRAAHGLAPAATRRDVVWHVFDNAADARRTRLRHVRTDAEVVALPPRRPPFLTVALRTPGAGTTSVYLRKDDATRYEVVGIDRTPAPAPRQRP